MRFRLLPNPRVDRQARYTLAEQWILSLARHREVVGEITSWPDYQPTPLLDLPALANTLGVGRLSYKDESHRFGLGTFKALGGAYGVLRVIQDEVERLTEKSGITGRQVLEGAHKDIAAGITVTCASDGNHGRSVAWGAQRFGCKSVVYLPSAVSAEREAAIAQHGAEIVRATGSYDEAVAQAQRDARHTERFVVSDTSYEGNVNIPRDIMQGYTVILAETLEQLPAAEQSTHVFLQGGVGGFAASVIGHLWEKLGPDRPTSIVVEPDCADCLFESATHGRPTQVTDVHRTVMGCLACGEVSPLAWYLLDRGADAFMTIPDEASDAAVRVLADQTPPISAGPSGAAGLGGLMCVAGDEDARRTQGLDSASRVLVIGTEGATL
jgi:diaminopropionate ammonia-lyase